MCHVWESFVHASGVEVPHGRPRHDVQSEWSKDEKVHCGVCLFHEACLLPSCLHAGIDGHWAQKALHEKLARKGEEGGIEGDESKVLGTFAILDWRVGVIAGFPWKRIGEEEGGVEGILWVRVDEIQRCDESADDERIEPSVPCRV